MESLLTVRTREPIEIEYTATEDVRKCDSTVLDQMQSKLLPDFPLLLGGIEDPPPPSTK